MRWPVTLHTGKPPPWFLPTKLFNEVGKQPDFIAMQWVNLASGDRDLTGLESDIPKSFSISKNLLHVTGLEPVMSYSETDYESAAFNHSAIHA